MYGYSPEVVRFSYQSALDYYAAMGIELSQADREQLAADTIDHFIGLGLIENKLREAGQDIITEEQAQSLRTYAQNLYESVWQGLYQELTASGEEVSEAQVSQWLEEQGYTVDAYYQEAPADGDEKAETFRYVFPQEIVDGLTHTITLPVAWLAGAADPAEVTVEISGKDYQEAEVAGNRFVIRLREEPLVFVRQPADMTALMGETAQFQVEASVGAFPYAYRWQIAQEKPAHGRMWQGRGKQFCL